MIKILSRLNVSSVKDAVEFAKARLKTWLSKRKTATIQRRNI